MSTSQFQNMRAALAALIAARFATDGITDCEVWEYEPRSNWTREDKVWLGSIRVDQQPGTFGDSARVVFEELTMDLTVWAPRSGGDLDDQKLAEQRAEAIFASVENALRNGDTVGSTVMFAQVDSFESIPTFDELGAVGIIEAVITAQANI